MHLEDREVADIDIKTFVDEFSHCFTGECRVGVLQTLSQITRIITASADLAASLPLILAVMRQQLKMRRGLLTLYDRASETIFVHDSFGLSDEEKARGAVLPGEGVINKVVETGKTLIARTGAAQNRGLKRSGKPAPKPRSFVFRSSMRKRCLARWLRSAAI